MKTSKMKIFILASLATTCLGAASLTWNNAVTASANSVFEMVNGASVRMRTTADETAIRFIAKVADTEKNYRMLILPTDILEYNKIEAADDIVAELKTVYGENYEQYFVDFEVEASTHAIYGDCIMGSMNQINSQYYNEEYTGIAYYMDGANYVYASFAEGVDIYSNSRTVSYVGSRALNEKDYVAEDATTTSQQKAALEAFVKGALDGDELVINQQAAEVKVGEKVEITTNAEGLAVIYESSNKDVLTVDENGKVEFVGVGTASVIAKIGESFSDEVVYTVSAAEPEKLEGVKLFNFDEENLGSIYCPNATTSYSTEVKYGKEKGSTKVVQGSGSSNILFEAYGFTELDVSVYDYIIFRVYNANDYAIKFELDWLPVVVCAAGEWTDIKTSVKDLPEKFQTNIKDLQFKAMKDSNNSATEGLTLYLSALYGCTEEVIEGGDEELEGVKLFNFDESGIDVYPNPTTYSTEVKYGKEAGSTKVVMTGTSTLLFEAWGFVEKDVTAYDYIVFRVFNANEYAIELRLTQDLAYTVCAPNVWTEIKINVSDLPSGKQTDISGIRFEARDGDTDQGKEGLTIYLSAMYGCVEE